MFCPPPLLSCGRLRGVGLMDTGGCHPQEARGEACCSKRTQVEPCYPQFNLPIGARERSDGWGVIMAPWSLGGWRERRGGDGGESDGCCLSLQLNS